MFFCLCIQIYPHLPRFSSGISTFFCFRIFFREIFAEEQHRRDSKHTKRFQDLSKEEQARIDRLVYQNHKRDGEQDTTQGDERSHDPRHDDDDISLRVSGTEVILFETF